MTQDIKNYTTWNATDEYLDYWNESSNSVTEISLRKWTARNGTSYSISASVSSTGNGSVTTILRVIYSDVLERNLQRTINAIAESLDDIQDANI